MGAATVPVEMTTSTSQPSKGRKFELVRVAGTFSRGRWKCVDYPDGKTPPELMDTLSKFDSGARVYSADYSIPKQPEASTIVVSSMVQPPNQDPQLVQTQITTVPIQTQMPESQQQRPQEITTTTITTISPQPHAPVPTIKSPDAEDDTSIGSVNVVAIDSKIEQAMDLVKTHLTFAVREEVEVLRLTIAELEQRTAATEQQNNFFRQFVPAEVLANLDSHVQQFIAARAAVAPPTQNAPTPVAKGTVVTIPREFQGQHFESTLNNVVAEVRQAVSGGGLFSLGQPPKRLPNQPDQK
ncbi:unnamed protein product, partial [Mesorhabditis spiculigera]